MKIERSLSLCAAALLLGPAAALSQTASPLTVFMNPSGDYGPMNVIQTEAPIYPRQMVLAGVNGGQATVAVQVDESGALTDVLVTAYSHPEFADAAVAAIRRWHYEPARIKGVPTSATENLTFDFKSVGAVVVDLSLDVYNEQVRFRLLPNSASYGACTLAQLDRIPTPIVIVKPAYSQEAARRGGVRDITVDFYIDEKGHVRMPAVSREMNDANPELAAAAVTAVAQWKFEPPMAKGRPVLVLARQDFNFKPAP
jgi:TonB family protein